jgi:transposase
MSCPVGWVRLSDNVLVAKGYRLVQRDQQFLLPENMRDWLPAWDPVWLVISAVAGLDTSGLHAKRRTGGAGRAGYDPDMLLTLLIWAWAHGLRSSRVIERLCQRDVAFRIICGGDRPDHVTISRFRARAAGAMAELFTQVLVLCARLGMGQLGVVALDSVKIASDASLGANRSEEGLRKAAAEQAEADVERRVRELAAAAAAEHAATDAAEDALYGADRRGDEVPEELVDPRSRAARIAQALEELAADNAKREAKREANREAQPEAQRGVGARREAKREAQGAAVAERKRGREQDRQARRAVQLDAFRQRREQRAITPMGLPPLEIRVEILTQNLAEARARHQAKVDRYDAGAKRGRRPVPVQHAYRVMRVKAALERAIAAEQAAGQRAQAAQQQAAQQRTQAAPTAHQQLLAPPATVAEQPVEPSTGSTASSEPKRKPVEPKRNITDPQSRMMPLRGGGWLQGYNCQAVTSSDGVIIATSVGNNPSDATAFGEMMDKAVAAAALIDAHRPAAAPTGIGMLLADAGYLSNDNLTAPGPDRLIAVGKRRELAAAAREHPTAGPPPPGATPIEAMAHRLRTPEEHALYTQRGHIAETPFAHAKHNLGFRRFTSRGIKRATAEFSFHGLVHNLFKAIGTGHLAPAAC